MTPKQQRFACEYLIDLNATQAATRAGYSEKTAPQQGGRLLKNVQVAEAIKEVQAKAANDSEVTLQWLISELQQNHRMALEGTPALDRYGNPTGHVVRQLAASNKSLELLAKLTGNMVERRDVTTHMLDSMSEEELEAERVKLEAEIAELKRVTH